MTGAVGYLCHACGTRLERRTGSLLLWCPRCKTGRRVPTHPALIVPGHVTSETT